MTRLTDITEMKQLDFDSVLAEFEAALKRDESPLSGPAAAPYVATKDAGSGTEPHFCEVEAQCHELLGVNGGGQYPYTCGFKLAGTVQGCPRRKRLNGGAT